VVYIDTSVVLAELLAEDIRPPADLWDQQLFASRLVEYETWVRLNAGRFARSHGEAARDLLARIAFVELHPLTLARALEPFPAPVRTLDALHLASAYFVQERRIPVQLASYDRRMCDAARHMGMTVMFEPPAV
jgi:hypothetical protein